MAYFHITVIKSSISPLSVVFQCSEHYRPPRKRSFIWSEHSSKVSGIKSFGTSPSNKFSSSSRTMIRTRFRLSCNAKDTQNQTKGEGPPESLMKELKKRGMDPTTSVLEESNKGTHRGEGTQFREEDGCFSRANAVSTNPERNLTNQREQSMALNSEGLEELIPRARLLLTLGGTFFLRYSPLTLITSAFFSILYLYFGPIFVHDARNTPITPPEYIDLYRFLEEETILETAPRLNRSSTQISLPSAYYRFLLFIPLPLFLPGVKILI